METRANYVAIGAFVLIVIAAAFASLYWLYRSAQPGATQIARIVFPEPVTGLGTGGSVLFNGIRVGEVTRLDFAPGGGDQVIAFVRLNPNAPIKTDTSATLGFQGLTGVAYISLTGGSKDAPSLFKGDEDNDDVPTIDAKTSTFTSVLDSARSVLSRLNTTLDEVNGIISDNRDDVTVIVHNVRTMSQALADASPDVRGLVSDIAGAGRAVASIVPQIGNTVSHVDTLLGGIQPEQVTTIVNNIEAFSTELPQLSKDAGEMFTSIGGKLDEAASTLGEALGGVKTVVAAVDPQEIKDIVAGIGSTVDTVAQRSAAVGEVIDNAAAITKDLRGVAGAVADRGDTIAKVIDNTEAITADLSSVSGTIAAEKETITTAITDFGALITEARSAVDAAGPAIKSASAAIAVVTPERVTAIMDGATALATGVTDLLPPIKTTLEAVASRADTIGATIENAAAVASDVASVSAVVAERREAIGKAINDVSEAAAGAPKFMDTLNRSGQNLEALFAAIDVEAVNAAVRDVGTITKALAAEAPNVPTIVANLTGALDGAQTLITGLSDETPAIREAIQSAKAAAASAEAFAATLPEMADSLKPGVENVSAVLSAIDAEQVSTIVKNAVTFSDTLASQAKPIEELIASANTAAGRIESVANALSVELPKVSDILAAADRAAQQVATFTDRLPSLGDTLQSGLDTGSAALAALNPDQVKKLLSDAGTFVEGLADQRENIAALVDNATSAAKNVGTIASDLAAKVPDVGTLLDQANQAASSVREFAEELPGIGNILRPAAEKAAAAIDAVDPEAVKTILTNASALSGSLNAQTEPLSQLIAKANVVADGTVSVVQEVSARAPAIGQAVDDASAAARNVAGAAARLPEFADTLQPGIENVAAALSAVDAQTITGIVDDTRTVTQSLSAEMPQVKTIIANVQSATTKVGPIIDDAQAAATNVRTASEALPRAAAELEPALASLAQALSSIDPEAVDAIVRNADAFAKMLADERETVAATLNSARATVADAQRITAAVAGRTDAIQATLDSAKAAAGSAETFAARLPEFADTLQPGIENVSTVLSSIDADAVKGIVTDAKTVSSALAAEAPKIGPLVDTVSATVDNARVISVRLRGELGTVETMLSNANGALADARVFAARLPDLAETIRPGVQNLSDAMSAIDPQTIETIMADVKALSATIANARGEVDTIMASVSASADNVQRLTGMAAERSDDIAKGIDGATRFATALGEQAPRIDAIVTDAGETLSAIRGAAGAIDGDRVNAILANLQSAAEAVGNRSQEIGQAIDNVANAARDLAEGIGSVGGDDGSLRETLEGARRLIANLEVASRKVDSVVENADRLLAGPVPGFVSNASRAALGVERVADAFASRADAIAGGLAKFSRGGLDDFRSLLNQGRITLAAIESAVTSFDRDPSRVIFGGGTSPTYSPQRR